MRSLFILPFAAVMAALPAQAAPEISFTNPLLMRLLQAQTCKVTIGAKTRSWIKMILGDVNDEVEAEAREWFTTTGQAKVNYERCIKLRGELYQEGWLE